MGDLAITGDGGLRGGGDRSRLRAVANQLEGVFLNQLLAKLDEPALEGDDPLLGDSNASKQFSQLFHQALGEKAAGSLGLADVIFKQLAGRMAVDRAAAKAKEASP